MNDKELAEEIERGLTGSDYIAYTLKDSEWRQIIAALRRPDDAEMPVAEQWDGQTYYTDANGRVVGQQECIVKLNHYWRQFSLAQTEIKGHMRVEDDLKVDAARYRFIRDLLAIEDVERLIADGNPSPDEDESLKTDAAIDTALKDRA